MQRDFEQVGNPLFVALKVGDIVYTGQTSAGPFGPQGVYQVQYGPHPTFAALFRSQGGVDSLYDAMREGFVGQYGPDLGGEISDVWQENTGWESELLCRQGERAEAEELCGMFGDPDGEHNDPAMLELAQQVIGQKQQRIAELEQSLTEGRGKFIALLPV